MDDFPEVRPRLTDSVPPWYCPWNPNKCPRSSRSNRCGKEVGFRADAAFAKPEGSTTPGNR